jgi:hypothetical protein
MPESASGAPGYYRLHPIGIAGRRGEEIAVVGPAAWAAPGIRRASRRHQRSPACTRKGGLRSLRGCVPNRDECRSPRPFRLGRWSSSDALVSDGAGGQLLGGGSRRGVGLLRRPAVTRVRGHLPRRRASSSLGRWQFRVSRRSPSIRCPGGSSTKRVNGGPIQRWRRGMLRPYSTSREAQMSRRV